LNLKIFNFIFKQHQLTATSSFPALQVVLPTLPTVVEEETGAPKRRKIQEEAELAAELTKSEEKITSVVPQLSAAPVEEKEVHLQPPIKRKRGRPKKITAIPAGTTAEPVEGTSKVKAKFNWYENQSKNVYIPPTNNNNRQVRQISLDRRRPTD
jgi:hypothetical protein